MTVLWKGLRIFRWLLIPIYAAYLVEFMINRPSHLDWRGLLLLSTEAVMFGVPLLFVAVGLLESMVRSRAGIPRPRDFGFRPPDQPVTQSHQFNR